MLRGHWRVVVTVIGLLAGATLLASGYYYLEAKEEQPYAPSQYQPAREPSLPIAVGKGKPASHPYQPYCKAPQNSGDSDLCAQWSGAASAAEANRLTRISLRVTYAEFAALIVSLIFTGWAAVAAAKAARIAEEATGDAEAALQIAKRNADSTAKLAEYSRTASENELRAWVSLDIKLSGMRRIRGEIGLSLMIKVENLGQTPALDVTLERAVRIVNSIKVGSLDRPEIQGKGTPLGAILPKGSAEDKYTLTLNRDEIASWEKANPDNIPVVFIEVTAVYRTMFDAEQTGHRITSRRFILGPNLGTVARNAELRRRWLSEEDVGLANVKMSQTNIAGAYVT